MKKNFLISILTICFIIPCIMLLTACGGDKLIYFDTIMPSEYDIEIEYTSANTNFTSRFVKKDNEYYGKQNKTESDVYYIDYYVLTDRAEKPYDYYSYNYVYEEWNTLKEADKYDDTLYGGTEYPGFKDSFTFGTLKDIIDTKITPFEKNEYVENCVVAGRPCVKYQIVSSDGSSVTYSYDKETSTLLEKVFIDNDGDAKDLSSTLRVTKFLMEVADNWKDVLLPALPNE